MERENTLLDEALDELSEVKAKLLRVENLMRQLKGEGSQEEVPEWYMHRLRVWNAIKGRGGIVTMDELHGIRKQDGYSDRRGVGGFFSGEGSLTKIADGKVALTERASQEVEKYKHLLAEGEGKE